MIKFIMLLLFGICNVNASEEKINYLENLTIENYDINFNKDVYNYDINIDNEDHLNISYDLSDDSAYVAIKGNGNFNNSDNLIEININNEFKYTIHAHKSINVSYTFNDEFEYMSGIKKEIVIILIIIISSILILGFYYVVFINKTIVNI